VYNGEVSGQVLAGRSFLWRTDPVDSGIRLLEKVEALKTLAAYVMVPAGLADCFFFAAWYGERNGLSVYQGSFCWFDGWVGLKRFLGG
jgi:hypothetical protein